MDYGIRFATSTRGGGTKIQERFFATSEQRDRFVEKLLDSPTFVCIHAISNPR
jgi:hypothetical protein